MTPQIGGLISFKKPVEAALPSSGQKTKKMAKFCPKIGVFWVFAEFKFLVRKK